MELPETHAPEAHESHSEVVYSFSDFEAASNRYHINSFITISTNALALYLIIFHSPKQFGLYKYYLLTMVLCAFVFDFHFSFISAPVFLFPYSGFCLTGIFSRHWGLTVQAVDFVSLSY